MLETTNQIVKMFDLYPRRLNADQEKFITNQGQQEHKNSTKKQKI